MSGAIPEKRLVKQAMLSDSNMVRKTVELYAASANSQTNYSSGDRLLFSIPAYAHSFIDFSKSYMKFVGKTTNSSNVALRGKALFYDGIPCFDRLQIRANGTVLEDIQQYQNASCDYRENQRRTLRATLCLGTTPLEGQFTLLTS